MKTPKWLRRCGGPSNKCKRILFRRERKIHSMERANYCVQMLLNKLQIIGTLGILVTVSNFKDIYSYFGYYRSTIFQSC